MKKLIFGIISIMLLANVAISCSKKSEDVNINPPIVDEGKKLSEINLSPENNIYGHIVDENYNPIAGVVVSDAYTVVTTNEKGEYQFKKDSNASFVFFSTPSGYQINTSSERNMAYFYQKLANNTTPQKADFILKKLETAESKFSLYAIGDPQVANQNEVNRFINETMADIQTHIAAKQNPVYGISLGDVVADQPSLFNTMKTVMGSLDMRVFTTIGNHDKTGGNSTTARNSSSFENHYGPLNYSFNRGEVHFVCLDNVVFTNNSAYGMGFSEQQIDWLEKDLSMVPKDKMLIVYYHMPIRGTNFSTRSRLFNLIKDFKEVHLMAGHTHYNENYLHQVDGKKIYEHVHAASCGAWWKSTINGDGTPNGYAVYEIEGSTIKNWIYKPTNLPEDFQLRLHWGNSSYGGNYGNFSYGKSSNTLIANVWNADPDWKIEVYQNNTKLGDMSLNSALNKDAWSLGYHLGILNRNPDNYTTATKHLYTFDLPANLTGGVKVIATDRFGRKYEQNTITTDLSSAISY